jgi:hypothetical protein
MYDLRHINLLPLTGEIMHQKYDQNNQYYVLSFYLVGGSAIIVYH